MRNKRLLVVISYNEPESVGKRVLLFEKSCLCVYSSHTNEETSPTDRHFAT